MKKLSLTAAVAFLMASFSAVAAPQNPSTSTTMMTGNDGYIIADFFDNRAGEILVCPDGKARKRVKNYNNLFVCAIDNNWDNSAKEGTEIPAIMTKEELARRLGPNFVVVGLSPAYVIINGMLVDKVVIYYKKK
jgi:hypothetical protein